MNGGDCMGESPEATKISDEISLADFENLDSELKREQKVPWEKVVPQLKKKCSKGVVLKMSAVIDTLMKKYDCSAGCIRRKIYALRDANPTEAIIKYGKDGNRSVAYVRFM